MRATGLAAPSSFIDRLELKADELDDVGVDHRIFVHLQATGGHSFIHVGIFATRTELAGKHLAGHLPPFPTEHGDGRYELSIRR